MHLLALARVAAMITRDKKRHAFMTIDSRAKHIYFMTRRCIKDPEWLAKITASDLCGCGYLFPIDVSLLRIFP